MPRVGLQYGTVVFPEHTHLLMDILHAFHHLWMIFKITFSKQNFQKYHPLSTKELLYISLDTCYVLYNTEDPQNHVHLDISLPNIKYLPLDIKTRPLAPSSHIPVGINLLYPNFESKI